MILALLTLFLSVAHAGVPTVTHDDLEAFGHHLDVARRTVRAGGWHPSTRPAREAAARGLRRLAESAEACDDTLLERTAELLQPAGLTLTLHRVAEQRFLLVHDAVPGRGGPVLALRCGPAEELLVQAPHGWYDLHTDDIAREAFLRGNLRAALFNSVHRYESTPGETSTDPVHPADVTDHPASLFQTSTLALTVARPTLRVVQLHGFAEDTADALVILSSGSAAQPPTKAAGPAAEALELPLRVVRVFGVDTDVLGGTLNAQARALRQSPSPRFLHVELARPVRDALTASPEACARFLLALGSVSWSR